MKIEKRNTVPTPPPVEVVITLTEAEATRLAGLLFSGIAFDQTVGGIDNPVGKFARELNELLKSQCIYGPTMRSKHIELYGQKLVHLTEY